MGNRRGRKRKDGPRDRQGHLKRRAPADSPRAIAATMPHRRGLGDKATDQRAETELGRMALRGELEDVLVTAGEAYVDQWRGYLVTLVGPHALVNGQGTASCRGCESADERKWCACAMRQRIWFESQRVLWNAGKRVAWLVTKVAFDDLPCPYGEVHLLRLGLQALAAHFGLTNCRTRAYQKATSQITPAN